MGGQLIAHMARTDKRSTEGCSQFRQGSQETKITKASFKLSVLMNVHGSGQMGISTKVAHTNVSADPI